MRSGTLSETREHIDRKVSEPITPSHLIQELVHPAGEFSILDRIIGGKIGLDIENSTSINLIQARHAQGGFLALQEPDDNHQDRIGACRAAR
jgi:hypothetical protein